MTIYNGQVVIVIFRRNKTTGIGTKSAHFVVESFGVMYQFCFVEIFVDFLHNFIAAFNPNTNVNYANFSFNLMLPAFF